VATAAAATGPQDSRPQQLWLDVARPIQPAPPRRERRPTERRDREDDAAASPQMELRMVARPPTRKAVAPEAEDMRRAPPSLPAHDGPIAEARPCFVLWLLGHTKSGGVIGELAKAAKADRLFPRAGSAEDVRARFGAAGADGDAYAALDDAERAYDRAT
jgi:hypothetical protein